MSPRDAAISFAGLPAILREIAEVAGLEAALQLARHHGGTEIRIPIKVGDTHWLTRCVGRAAATRICDHFAVRDADNKPIGNFRTYLPFAGAGLMQQALADLAQALQTEDLGVREAVRRFGLSDRTVKRVKARLRADRQGSLPLLTRGDTRHAAPRLAPGNIAPTITGITRVAAEPEPVHADPLRTDRAAKPRLRPRPERG